MGDLTRTTRRSADAALTAAFGLFCLVAGPRSGDHPVLAVFLGLAALGYAVYIVRGRGTYFMSYVLYAIAVIGLGALLLR